ncbi:MAG: hypothetical protein AAFZ18_16895 [Myxococcota bacterium]
MTTKTNRILEMKLSNSLHQLLRIQNMASPPLIQSKNDAIPSTQHLNNALQYLL